MPKLYLLLAAVAVLWHVELPAQTPSYAHYGVKEGLPGNVVYCAGQDHRGFMWFGTDKGLARFDGVRFQIFGIKDGLPDPEVLSLFVDSQDRIWLSSLRQKPFYFQNGKVITAKEDTLLARINLESEICDFAEDRDRRIWIMGRTQTAFIYDETTVQKKTFPQILAQIMVNETGVLGLGLSSFMNEQEIIFEFKPQNIFFKSAAYYGSSVLYSCTDRLMLLDADNATLLSTLPLAGGRVYTDRSGRFWAFPTTGGAICYNNPDQNITNPQWYLKDKIINTMFEDKNGNYWFCTSGDGIYVLSPGKAVTLGKAEGFRSDNFTAIATDHNGLVLAGDNLGNVYRFGSGATVQKMELGMQERLNRTRQIITDAQHTLWIANDQGLFYEKGKSFGAVPGLSGLKGICVEGEYLWFGTHARCGFFKKSKNEMKFLTNRRTTTLCIDDEHSIWVGGSEGVYNDRDSFQLNWGERFPLLKSRIVTIQNAGSNRLWIVTPESGLLLASVKNGEITHLDHINLKLQNPVENIQAVFPDLKNRKVWLATNNGVFGLDTETWQLAHFDQHDGLADNDVNCVLVNHDTLWAGTVSGLSYFDLGLNPVVGDFPSYISTLTYQLDDQSVTVSLVDSVEDRRHITIPSRAVMLTLGLSALEYSSQGNFEYRCVIQKTMPPVWFWTRHNIVNWISGCFGYQGDTTVLQGNILNFGFSLTPGAYAVEVSAVTLHGVVSNRPDHWMIVMLPRWYQTIWLDLLLWTIAGYGIWRVFKARLAYRKLNIMVSELQLRTLQTQINPHFIGNSINTIHQFFYPPDRKGLSLYIQLFTQLLRRTIMLSEKHFNRFEEELAYDRDYLDMIKIRFRDQFSYTIEGAEEIPSGLLFPSMLLQPVLENATIHGLSPEGNSHLQLLFSYAQQHLRCTITDNGIGINASRARISMRKPVQKSKGLELVYKKVEAFNMLYNLGLIMTITDLSDENPENRGTRVDITFNPNKINIHENYTDTAH